jgi:hypothetical protein
MKKVIGSLGMFAGMLILAGTAMAQQEVAPDHFEGSVASAMQSRKSVRPSPKAKAVSSTQKSAKKVSSQKHDLTKTASLSAPVTPGSGR